MANKNEIASRRRARSKLVQALYQYALTGQSAAEIERQFIAEGLGDIDVPYFSESVHAVIDRVEELDRLLIGLLDRPPVQLDPVERSILRLGADELSARLDIPCRVVIYEAIELAQRFGAEKSHRYINGVLDRLAREIEPRALERTQGRSS